MAAFILFTYRLLPFAIGYVDALIRNLRVSAMLDVGFVSNASNFLLRYVTVIVFFLPINSYNVRLISDGSLVSEWLFEVC